MSKTGLVAFCALLLFTSSFRRKHHHLPPSLCVSITITQRDVFMVFNSSGKRVRCVCHVRWPLYQSLAPGREMLPRPARKEPSRGADACGVHYYVPPAQISPCMSQIITAMLTFVSFSSYIKYQSHSNKVWKHDTSSFMTDSRAHDRSHPRKLS